MKTKITGTFELARIAWLGLLVQLVQEFVTEPIRRKRRPLNAMTEVEAAEWRHVLASPPITNALRSYSEQDARRVELDLVTGEARHFRAVMAQLVSTRRGRRAWDDAEWRVIENRLYSTP